MAGTAYADATLGDVLDMQVGVAYSELYSDPAADIWDYARAAACGRCRRAIKGPPVFHEFLVALRKEGEHGQAFAYKTVNTEVLCWVMQRVGGSPLARLLSRRIWSQLECEEDGYLSVDSTGTAMGGGGLAATLRDMARFGEMLRCEGSLRGRQIVPASVVADIRRGQRPRQICEGRLHASRRYSYRRHVVGHSHEHHAFEARGIHGQRLYIAPDAEMVSPGSRRIRSRPVPQMIPSPCPRSLRSGRMASRSLKDVKLLAVRRFRHEIREGVQERAAVSGRLAILCLPPQNGVGDRIVQPELGPPADLHRTGAARRAPTSPVQKAARSEHPTARVPGGRSAAQFLRAVRPRKSCRANHVTGPRSHHRAGRRMRTPRPRHAENCGSASRGCTGLLAPTGDSLITDATSRSGMLVGPELKKDSPHAVDSRRTLPKSANALCIAICIARRYAAPPPSSRERTAAEGVGGFRQRSAAVDGMGRIFFQFGPDEHPDRLVASVIMNLLSGREALCTHGRQIRQFSACRGRGVRIRRPARWCDRGPGEHGFARQDFRGRTARRNCAADRPPGTRAVGCSLRAAF